MSQCGDHLDPNSLPTHYCEFVWNETESQWDLVGSNLPNSDCYCSDPNSTMGGGSSTSLYTYPCCPSSSAAFAVGEPDDVACYGTYRFQNGVFYMMDAVSSRGIGCPMDLETYSKANPGFSFGLPVEFGSSRGVYVYQNGYFRLIDETPSGGAAPKDLVEYSRKNPEFYALATIRFTQTRSEG